ncbi:MAG: hypothetical protein ACLTTU_02645 [Bilophila wadsworthia]
MFRILVINPGSTSTKIAVYEDEAPLFVKPRPRYRQTVPGSHGAVELRHRLLLDVLTEKALIRVPARLWGRVGCCRRCVQGVSCQ